MVRRIDIPTALTARETHVLRFLALGRQVVEAGALLGYSTVALAQVARHVVSIDPHDGYPRWQPRPTLGTFRWNLRRFGVEARVKVVVGYAEQHLPDYPADLAFLDLTGDYAVTVRSLELARARVLACHDFGRGGCSGATAAVEEFARCRCLRLELHDTLAVMRRSDV